jgi:hypothetical protein
MSNAPVAVEVQPLDIIDPIGMSIVKLPVLPFTLPLTIMALPEPARRIVPENADPFWVSCHVVVPIAAPDIPDPIMEPLESDVAPTQFPVKVAVGLGPETAGDCEPHATKAPLLTSVKRTKNHRFTTTPNSEQPPTDYISIDANVRRW